jgi:hypothetical protein
LWKTPKRTNPSQVCPLCGKSSKELLIHLRIDHEIEDTDQFIEAVRLVGENKWLTLIQNASRAKP